MELEEENRRQVAHEAAREWRDEDVDDQKVAVRPEEANAQKKKVCNAWWKHRKVTRPLEKGEQRISQPGKRQKKKYAARAGSTKQQPDRSRWRVRWAKEHGTDGREGQGKTARDGTRKPIKKEQCQQQAEEEQCQQQAEEKQCQQQARIHRELSRRTSTYRTTAVVKVVMDLVSRWCSQPRRTKIRPRSQEREEISTMRSAAQQAV